MIGPTMTRHQPHEDDPITPQGGDMKQQRYCGFCGKYQKDVERLIDGPTLAVCNECIVLMHGMLDAPSKRKSITLDEFRKKRPDRDPVLGIEAAVKVCREIADERDSANARITTLERQLAEAREHMRALISGCIDYECGQPVANAREWLKANGGEK